MAGLGTIINVIGILAGGFIGLLFGKVMGERIQNSLMTATGVCVLFIGISGALEEMMTVSQGRLNSGGSMMMIGCLVLGSLLGEWLNIEDRMEVFGTWLKGKTNSDGDVLFIEGFVNTSLTICIGAMAVVGAIQDGIMGDYSLLAAKAVLDFVIVIVMTASMGKGCIFAAIPVALFQGGITCLSGLIEPLMTEQALSNLSLTGSVLVFCVGVNLVWGKKVRVANMLPGIILAVLWAALPIG